MGRERQLQTPLSAFSASLRETMLVGVPTGRPGVNTGGPSVIIERHCGKKCGFHQIFRTPGAFKETIVLLSVSPECFPIHLGVFSNSLRCFFKGPPVVIKALRGSSKSLRVSAIGTQVNCQKGKRVSEKTKECREKHKTCYAETARCRAWHPECGPIEKKQARKIVKSGVRKEFGVGSERQLQTPHSIS